jgi:cytochrome c biogenesis protein CcmG, thiol:disulfide interchange protein DsbE
LAELAETASGAPTRRGRWLYVLPVAIFSILVGVFLFRLFAGDPQRLPSALLGRPIPTFALPPLDGLRDASGRPLPGLATEDLRAGMVTVLNVWASWCAPCRLEHPLLMDLATDTRLRLVGIGYKDRPENARRFLGNFGNPFAAVGFDDSGRTGIEFGVYGVPETFVIDGRGIVRHRHVGPLTPEDMPGLRAKVREAAAR